MKILGWIRVGDKAACGGTVAEGLPNCISHGREYSYYGAAMACRRNCHIGEAHPAHTLPNGRKQPHHGHRTMPGGCPLISTLNDINGRANESDTDIPETYVLDNGEWVGAKHHADHNEMFDEYFILADEHNGPPARNRFYRITLDTGELIEGYSDDHGRTAFAMSDKRVPVKIEIAPPSTMQPD